jgi:hypothetical protein
MITKTHHHNDNLFQGVFKEGLEGKLMGIANTQKQFRDFYAPELL